MAVYQEPFPPNAVHISEGIADISSLIGGLSAWAAIAGYLCQYTFLSTLGAPWAVGQLSSGQIVSAGSACLLFIAVLIAAIFYLQYLLGALRSPRRIVFCIAVLALMGTLAVIALFIHTAYFEPIKAVIFGATVAVVVAALLNQLFIWGAPIVAPSASYKLILIAAAIVLSSPYAAMCGYTYARHMGNAKHLSVVSIQGDSAASPWLLVNTLGDGALLMKDNPPRSRSFRIVETSKINEICSSDGSDPSAMGAASCDEQ